MTIHFTKMHGIGNDYIYVDCTKNMLPDPAGVAIAMSPRHFSVGSDGLVLICPSEIADAKMRMFNADGSEGKMCGNAIRCVGKYLYEHKMVPKEQMNIETLSGIKHLRLTTQNGHVQTVSVDMGHASFAPKDIPIDKDTPHIDEPIEVLGKTWRCTCVSVGNPHQVLYVDNVDDLELEKIGPAFEHHPMFLEGVNTEFVRIIDRHTLQMRVWERGSGETWACGTGACAVVASSVKNGIVDPATPITVKLRGGELVITCTADYQIEMCGPAATVYEGVYEYEDSNQ